MNNLFKKNHGKVLAGILLCGLIILSCGCGTKKPEVKQKTDTAMGTVIRQSVYLSGRNSEAAEAGEADVTDEVMEQIRRLEQEMLSWRLETSELYQINEAAAQQEQTIPVSPKLAELLQSCQEVSAKSNGAFDITIGKVVRLWNIDKWAAGGTFAMPSAEQIAQAMKDCGYQKLSVTGAENTAMEIAMPKGMQLDLGAVGKGIALSEISALLRGHEEVAGAVISVGGSILTYGSKPDSSSWKVGIVNPLKPDSNIGYLELSGEWCISTSGDYERYVEIDGERIHHILDPKTGYSAKSGVRSVTILMRDGLMSDALSTACFVMGVEDGIVLAEEFGAEALFVDSQGEIFMTEGMKEYFHLS